MSELSTVISAAGVAIGAVFAGVAALISAVQTARRVKAIDHAVNGGKPGEMKMGDQVSKMAEQIDSLAETADDDGEPDA